MGNNIIYTVGFFLIGVGLCATSMIAALAGKIIVIGSLAYGIVTLTRKNEDAQLHVEN